MINTELGRHPLLLLFEEETNITPPPEDFYILTDTNGNSITDTNGNRLRSSENV